MGDYLHGKQGRSPGRSMQGAIRRYRPLFGWKPSISAAIDIAAARWADYCSRRGYSSAGRIFIRSDTVAIVSGSLVIRRLASRPS